MAHFTVEKVCFEAYAIKSKHLSVLVQVYKRAKALDQSDNDISAVYRAYIH